MTSSPTATEIAEAVSFDISLIREDLALTQLCQLIQLLMHRRVDTMFRAL